jgi:hypothetical protein
MQKSILVAFGQLPSKNKKFFQQFDKIIGPNELEEFIDTGSIYEAYEFVNKLSRLTLSNGSRLSKLITYKDYELWWINHENLYHNFCLPYTKYRRLLEHLKSFDKIYLYQPSCPELFSYFFKTHNCQCFIFRPFSLRKLLPIPFGILIQLVLSVVFLPWLIISRPKIMVFTGDKFDFPHDYDFRMKFIYEELRKKKIRFVEFIRSLEPWSVVLNHAFKRKRPVIYPTAIADFVRFFTGIFRRAQEKELVNLFLSSKTNPEEHFWFLVATHYLRDVQRDIWSIRIMKFILQSIGVKSAIIVSACERNFRTVLGCKLNKIPTTGILHGASSKYYNLYDFMSGFDGKKMLSVDKYGLWSDWWREYYIKNSKAYKPEQLYVSGLMRPLKEEEISTESGLKKGPLKVLFVSEQLANPSEIMPYLSALLKVKDFDLYLKFRPYRDGFERWLKKHQPEFLKRVQIFRGSMHETIPQSDVVVGSHSTAVLEALLHLKPFVFFWTNKWGDYFEIKSLNQSHFFAESPKKLVDCIRNSIYISKEELKKLQNQFFGNPYQNGSKWVVEQAIEYLKLPE